MKKVISTVLLVLLMLINAVPVLAQGNEWVYDESQVISEETEEYIKNLNENVFVNYKDKPQLAIIVIDNLPSNINTYKLDMFNEYGVGTAEENCGMLFVLAINDRQYGLEIGDGFEKGSLLRKDLETDFITSEIKSALKEEKYDAVIFEVVKHLETLMADEENGIYIQKSKEAINNVIDLINSIGTVEYSADCSNLISAARTAYNDLTDEQKKSITNYEVLKKAEERYQELFSEVTITGLFKFFETLCTAVLLVALGIFVFRVIELIIRKRKINKLCDKYDKHIKIANIYDLEEFKHSFYKHISSRDLDISVMDDKFQEFMHSYYISAQVNSINNTNELQEPLDKYILRLKQVNDLIAFVNCTLTPVNEIIDTIDYEENKKRETRRQNTNIVNNFFKENEYRITCEEIKQDLKNELCRRVNDMYVLREDELEKVFSESLKELSFKWEFEKFCDEHKNEIDSNRKDFNSSEFYRSIKATENYRNYRSDGVFHNHWMLPLLMLHMSNRRKNRIEREEREEKERIRREKMRREEEARRERQRMSSINSSFGSGFGGGHSSGGGFSGGW